MPYNIFVHRHNFAVWAAARSVQRGWKNAKVLPLRDAIEKCGVREFLKKPSCLETNLQDFEILHRQWCRSIQSYLWGIGLETSYGRAAKLLAVYIKAMVIVSGAENSPLAQVAHPPIDRILLQNLSTEYNLRVLRFLPWTKLDSYEYYNLVGELRKFVPPNQPFWMIEKHWTVTNNGIKWLRIDAVQDKRKKRTTTKKEAQTEKDNKPMKAELENNNELRL